MLSVLHLVVWWVASKVALSADCEGGASGNEDECK